MNEGSPSHRELQYKVMVIHDLDDLGSPIQEPPRYMSLDRNGLVGYSGNYGYVL